ncbi:Wall-associated receptor kinase, partial [Quillaja saponaria]
YGFVVEDGYFNFSSLDLKDLQNKIDFPVVINWGIGNEKCQEARKNATSYACQENSFCIELENGQGYHCKCNDRFKGHPYLSGVNGCQGAGLGFAALPVIILWLYLVFQQRKLIKLKERFFSQNGGLILQKQLSRQERTFSETAKIFTAEELKKATKNYDEDVIIGKGGFGIVYKGFVADNRVVAIKKSKIVDRSQIEQFINQQIQGIRHILDNPSEDSSRNRRALSYLHCAASTPIIHRDVKTANILLDKSYTAKVSDFGASRLVPIDQTEFATMVQGTLGYLDPEYMLTNQLTEKSDLYSFGVVLAELLTGMKALSFDKPEEERSLAMYFLSFFKENRLFEVIESGIVDEGNIETVKEVARLATRCLKLKGEDRPSMKEVGMELEGLKRTEKHPWVSMNPNSEESEYMLHDMSGACEAGDSSVNTAYDNMKDNILIASDKGR